MAASASFCPGEAMILQNTKIYTNLNENAVLEYLPERKMGAVERLNGSALNW